jgi:heme A synthase
MARPSRAFRRLCGLTAAATYLLIVVGGVVRVSGSGLGCGESSGANDWPLCHGGLLPPLNQQALIEFTHRWLAAIATALVIALAVTAWVRYRHLSRIAWTATVVVALFVVQIILGAVTVKLSLPGSVILIHLANAMLLLGALVYIAFTASTVGTERDRMVSGRRPPYVRMAAVAAGATYALVISGALVVAKGAGAACAAWPLCGGGFELGSGELASVNLLHRIIAGGVVVLAGIAVMAIRRAVPHDRQLRVMAIVATALLLAQIVAGAVVVELKLPSAARGIHLALASALWVAFLLIALLTRTAAPDAVPERRRSTHTESRPPAAVASS